MKEFIQYIIEELRLKYFATIVSPSGVQYVYEEWIEDDSEEFHPYYELMRRSTAARAFSEVMIW